MPLAGFVAKESAFEALAHQGVGHDEDARALGARLQRQLLPLVPHERDRALGDPPRDVEVRGDADVRPHATAPAFDLNPDRAARKDDAVAGAGLAAVEGRIGGGRAETAETHQAAREMQAFGRQHAAEDVRRRLRRVGHREPVKNSAFCGIGAAEVVVRGRLGGNLNAWPDHDQLI